MIFIKKAIIKRWSRSTIRNDEEVVRLKPGWGDFLQSSLIWIKAWQHLITLLCLKYSVKAVLHIFYGDKSLSFKVCLSSMEDETSRISFSWPREVNKGGEWIRLCRSQIPLSPCDENKMVAPKSFKNTLMWSISLNFSLNISTFCRMSSFKRK